MVGPISASLTMGYVLAVHHSMPMLPKVMIALRIPMANAPILSYKNAVVLDAARTFSKPVSSPTRVATIVYFLPKFLQILFIKNVQG